mmetsp:Transcript_4266/g.12155  ORF Transcript_4266/g.12155 Transcript_4266/m.12155 type:complete len:300 (-) Transcript_4266:91-990(-)
MMASKHLLRALSSIARYSSWPTPSATSCATFALRALRSFNRCLSSRRFMSSFFFLSSSCCFLSTLRLSMEFRRRRSSSSFHFWRVASASLFACSICADVAASAASDASLSPARRRLISIINRYLGCSISLSTNSPLLATFVHSRKSSSPEPSSSAISNNFWMASLAGLLPKTMCSAPPSSCTSMVPELSLSKWANAFLMVSSSAVLGAAPPVRGFAAKRAADFRALPAKVLLCVSKASRISFRRRFLALCAFTWASYRAMRAACASSAWRARVASRKALLDIGMVVCGGLPRSTRAVAR